MAYKGWEYLTILRIGTVPEQMKLFLSAFWQEEDAQDMVEYSLLLSFIVVCAVAIMTSTRVQISDIWSTINSALSSAISSSGS